MATTERDAQLLSVGKQCSHVSCNLIDFLPFKCQHCKENFCQEHFMVDAHKCSQYDESKHNRVAPDCPFCNTPVAFRVGQSPDARMEEHFEKECSVMTGKTGRTRTMPTCDRTSCKKVLFSPIRCEKCRKQFCPSHRFPSDHACSAPTAAPTSNHTKPAAGTNLLNNLNTNAKALNAKASAAGTATLGAIKKGVSTASSSTAPSSSSSSKTGSSTPRPFSKVDRLSTSTSTSIINHEINDSTASSTNASTDVAPTNGTVSSPPSPMLAPVTPKPPRFNFMSFKPRPMRAKGERESRRKALQARAQKGLLSAEEKVLLQELEAEKKDDCIIM